MTALVATDALPSVATDLVALGRRLRAGTVQIQVRGHGIGSGIVWQTEAGEGHQPAAAMIITNAHVVRAIDGQPLSVRLHDGRELPAETVAIEPEYDLAALRIAGEGLVPLEIGDSAALRVGELVVAVGNPFGREGALTVGVIAARAPAPEDARLEPADGDDEQSTGPRQPWLRGAELIQADLRLYPGNSGGPLADASGRVVGVNAMISGGLAFAIPSRLVRDFAQRARRPAQRVRLGITVLTAPLPPAQRERLGLSLPAAALVAGVDPDGMAQRAGLLPGDLIVAVGAQPIATAEHLLRALMLDGDATDLRLTVIRGGARRDLRVAVTPEQQAA
jgi:serine protease Do